jgi:hypothetical protein
MLPRASLVTLVVVAPTTAFALDLIAAPIPWPGFGTAFLLAAGTGVWTLVRDRRRRE